MLRGSGLRVQRVVGGARAGVQDRGVDRAAPGRQAHVRIGADERARERAALPTETERPLVPQRCQPRLDKPRVSSPRVSRKSTELVGLE